MFKPPLIIGTRASKRLEGDPTSFMIGRIVSCHSAEAQVVIVVPTSMTIITLTTTPQNWSSSFVMIIYPKITSED